MPPKEILSFPLLKSRRSLFFPSAQQSRHASTTRNPTPNQFAKNASAAYAKQQQPQYQSKPRGPTGQKPKPQQAQSARPRQDVGAGARPQQQSTTGSLLYRALTSLSSTFRLPAVHSTPPADTSSGTYSVHAPRGARAKLRSDPAAVGNNHTSVRQKLGYDAVARRVLLAMVAMPIVVVTSWVLFQRLFKGEEKKVFPVTPADKVGEIGMGGGNKMDDVLQEHGQEIGEAVGKTAVDGRAGV